VKLSSVSQRRKAAASGSSSACSSAAHLADLALDVLLEVAEPPLVGLAHHLGVDDGLPDNALLDRLGRRQDLDEAAVVVAAHGEDRMDDEVDAVAAPVELHAHRVDEERHVVGHDLDRRVRGLPAVVLEARVVDAHLRRPRPALAREVEVAERQAVEVEWVAIGHVLRSNPPIELADERLGQLGVGGIEVLAHARANGLGQCLFGVFDLHPSIRTIVVALSV
jgi:hypothetical protein